jgi:hypothetical protein
MHTRVPSPGPSPGVLLVVASAAASMALTHSQPPLKSAHPVSGGRLGPARLTAASSWLAAPRQRIAHEACRLEEDQA